MTKKLQLSYTSSFAAGKPRRNAARATTTKLRYGTHHENRVAEGVEHVERPRTPGFIPRST
ncbi:MAG TPA: hypothetical protein VIQ60_14460 [Gemmatimonadaceae bacterium]